jgi:general secretion pathway protein J
MTRARARGFTLLELLIAISLMAVLAVLSWRGLDSVLATRERLVAVTDETRALSVTFSQMGDDLRRSWVMRLTDPTMPTIGFLMDGNETWPAMQVLREVPAGVMFAQGAQGTPAQRVVYRLRAGQLERGFAPWYVGAATQQSMTTSSSLDAGQSASLFTWQPLLDRVNGIRFRAWIDGQGWLPATGLLMSAQGKSPVVGNVSGVEVLIERTSGERVLRIFPVKD